jgi:hypothetical protein
LKTDHIGERTEVELSNDSTSGGRKLDDGILGRRKGALVIVLVDDTQHDGQERYAKDVVAVRE